MTEAQTLMLQALKACRAWHDAERDGLGDFWQRSELCSYSEWITRKAIAAAEGAPFDEPYKGVPALIVWPTCELVRASEAEAQALAESVQAHLLQKVSGT